MTKFKDPWGFSKLDVFRTCHAKFKFQFIDKLSSDGSPAMERGQRMHENIESYLNGWTQELIPENAKWKEALDALKQKQFRAEQALGFDNLWKPLPNWFHEKTWLRVKMDASYKEATKGKAIDFKSGKYRIPSTEQIELYAISLHALNPELEEVGAEFWFLDTGDIYDKIYLADQLIALRSKYERYAAPLYTEEAWQPQPSNDCRWCQYSKTKGGPCKF